MRPMTARSISLRSRLMIVILVPLVIISLFAGFWRFNTAKNTSEELFDRTLIALTIAIARDVVASGGEALSRAALELMSDTSGGPLFYHVNGPDGSFLTGYGYPPAAPREVKRIENIPVLFEAKYRKEAVRVARLTELTTVDGITGYATVTVWQNMVAREALAQQLALRAAFVMGLLILTVAGVVWFGVNLGLKPLTDLEDAITQRSPDDLSVIRRKVPVEVSDIVDQLNILFKQVSTEFTSRDKFISDAAHQLRNPIAGIQAMAVAARDATNEADRLSRTEELVDAARHASRLTQQFLSYERARGLVGHSQFQPVDLTDLVREVCMRNAARCFDAGVELEFDDRAQGRDLFVHADRVMLFEAVQNLLDNALAHAGADNRLITVSVDIGNDIRGGDSGHGGDVDSDEVARVSVRDRGRGLPAADIEIAFERFGQLNGSQGSGLGLAIVKEIALQHGGTVTVDQVSPGVSFTIALRSIHR